jgi:hypothetical protein
VEELMRVYGIGATKAARYGRGFLEVVARAVSPPAGGAGPSGSSAMERRLRLRSLARHLH